jgi:hypothetical protein
MKSGKQTFGTILLTLALVLAVWWVAEGANIFTATESQVEEKDELFGTSTIRWEADFEPGLELVGPIAGVLLLGGFWLLYSAKRDERIRS